MSSSSTNNSLWKEEVETKNVDAILAQEMWRLPLQDRNKIQEEIHGVRSMAPEETMQSVRTALWQLDQELEDLPTASKQAYFNAKSNTTISRSDPFVLSDDVRLCFLRAELFDPGKAAIRYTKYLNLLAKYFGTVALERPLRYSDLSKDEQDLCRDGKTQCLPSRDRAGRLVLVHNGAIGGKNVVDGSTRVNFFWCNLSFLFAPSFASTAFLSTHRSFLVVILASSEFCCIVILFMRGT
jgi:hypothetical protein